jgi:hypothetical protein
MNIPLVLEQNRRTQNFVLFVGLSWLSLCNFKMTETDNLPVTPRRNYLTLLIAGIAIAALHLLHIHVPERVVIISKLLWAGIVIGINSVRLLLIMF